MFYAVLALLANRQMGTSKHTGVLSLFDREFIKTGIFSRELSKSFLPTAGMITRYAPPQGKSIRVDSCIVAGSVVSVYYDSLLSKD